MNKLILFFLLILCISCRSKSQSQSPDSIQQPPEWKSMAKGLWLAEVLSVEKSFLNDSKFTILKIDPTKYEFLLLASTEYGKIRRTAPDWAADFNLNLVINAGMYNQKDFFTNEGYQQNGTSINNPVINPDYNAMIAFNPQTKSPPFTIYDLTMSPWDSIKSNYTSYAQAMRMLDGNGKPLTWNKRSEQACSMVLMATDSLGFVYFISVRSPYTHNAAIHFLLSLGIPFRTTAYLEGGPEASLYVKVGNQEIARFGSYVSRTVPNDNNDHFWKLPNVIGVRAKR